MANKQIVDYIKEASDSKINKAEIIQNLKQSGWQDDEIRDAFSYISLYSGHSIQSKTQQVVSEPRHHHWISLVCLVLGYLWLISGLNKILGERFVEGFGDVVRGQIQNGQVSVFYRNILSSVVLPNAAIMSRLIEFAELGIGAILVIFGLWNFFRAANWRSFVLCLASIGSFVMILNIILSFGMPFPWIDTDNAFAQGASVEYIVLFISFVLSSAYFYEV